MKNLLQPRALRSKTSTHTRETNFQQRAAAITLRRHLKHLKHLLEAQEILVETLALVHPYSPQFPCDHPELARERAVLQGMKIIAQNLIK